MTHPQITVIAALLCHMKLIVTLPSIQVQNFNFIYVQEKYSRDSLLWTPLRQPKVFCVAKVVVKMWQSITHGTSIQHVGSTGTFSMKKLSSLL